jgi:phenylacetate-CoA ligase
MSGGSTGEPKPIRRTWAEERLLNAFRFRARQGLGMRATDLIASISLQRTPHAADRQIHSKLLNRLGLFRLQRVDCLLPPVEVVKGLQRIQPDIITGYAGAVAHAASAVLETGQQGPIRPRIVTTGAEVRTGPMTRQISEAFGVRPFNVYGAHEVNIIAWECPRTGQMHTCDDNVIVEILRPDGTPAATGDRGEVVITALHSLAMPFIRFRMDDVVTRGQESCPCGLPFATIRAVQGRMLDYFPLPDGRLLHPYEILDHVLHDRAEWSRRYQLVQERRDRVVLRVVLSNKPSKQRLDEIRRDARKALGGDVEFVIDFVQEIPSEPNGKFRTARSLVRSDYDGIEWDRACDGRRAMIAAATDKSAITGA